VLATSPVGSEHTLSTRGRLRAAVADMPGKWQDQFLRPGPWPQELSKPCAIASSRADRISSCPRWLGPLDLGPITTLTNFAGCLTSASWLVWLFFALLLIAIFGSRTASKWLDQTDHLATSDSGPPARLAAVLFFTSAVVLTGFVSLLFADLLLAHRLEHVAHGACCRVRHFIFAHGPSVCMQRSVWLFHPHSGTRRRITALNRSRQQAIDGVSAAIVFPIYNEDSIRVLEGLRATYESLERTGHIDRFDFFVLERLDESRPLGRGGSPLVRARPRPRCARKIYYRRPSL